MENRCVCCGSIIPEGRQVCKKCEVKAGMNGEGYKDPTAEQALWGLRQEEKRRSYVKALEEKYGVHKGDTVVIQETRRSEGPSSGAKLYIQDRKMKVVNLYQKFVLLMDKNGFHECFFWQEFLQKWKR